MRHAILGAGGIGGLLAATLARAGGDVVLLLRRAALADYPGRIAVDSEVLGRFDAEVPAVAALERDVDVLWVATKATQLVAALDAAPPERVGPAIVIPLLNGVDHVELLRARYANVVAGAIRVESERVAPGRLRQSSPFLGVELAGAPDAGAELEAAGIACRVRDDERSLLWEKLAFLAPVALATTALDGTVGEIRDDERFAACRGEAVAVARAEGAAVDAEAIGALHDGAPAAMRSSMQKDVEAGGAPAAGAHTRPPPPP